MDAYNTGLIRYTMKYLWKCHIVYAEVSKATPTVRNHRQTLAGYYCNIPEEAASSQISDVYHESRFKKRRPAFESLLHFKTLFARENTKSLSDDEERPLDTNCGSMFSNLVLCI